MVLINLWLWIPILITLLALGVCWWMLNTREGVYASIILGPIGCIGYLSCVVVYLLCWILLR